MFKNFLIKYKSWIIVSISFLLLRIIIFKTYWQASIKRGLGWENFYNYAEPAKQVLAANWHEICDWHPPLYYFFTSLLLHIINNQWIIYIFQVIIAFICVILAYKITNLFFSKKISMIVSFLVAIEPFYAWHNFMLSSENLEAPLFLLAIYFLFKFLKGRSFNFLFISALFFGLSTLTRPNHLFITLYISIVFAILYLIKKYLKINLGLINFKKIFSYLIIFNLIFLLVISPWVIRNKFVYDRYSLAYITQTNIFNYNLPYLISEVENTNYNDAYLELKEEALREYGANIGDRSDCTAFTNDELNKQYDYFKEKSNSYIKAHFFTYMKLHLIKTAPFYLQPGYFNMIRSYTGIAQKPDITGLISKGNFSAIIDYFVENINFAILIYFFGVILWGILSLALVISVFYSFFRDRDRFIFFIFSFLFTFYIALMTSPFVTVRYRLAILFIFFVPIIYLFSQFFHSLKNRNAGQNKKNY